MQEVAVRAHKLKPMTEEMRRKVERSYEESLSLDERDLHCPHCGRYLMTLYSDAGGHLKSKCPVCKTVTTFNLGCFRRASGYRKVPIYPHNAR